MESLKKQVEAVPFDDYCILRTSGTTATRECLVEYKNFQHKIRYHCEKLGGQFIVSFYRTDCEGESSSLTYAAEDEPFCVSSSCSSEEAPKLVEAFIEENIHSGRFGSYKCGINYVSVATVGLPYDGDNIFDHSNSPTTAPSLVETLSERPTTIRGVSMHFIAIENRLHTNMFSSSQVSGACESATKNVLIETGAVVNEINKLRTSVEDVPDSEICIPIEGGRRCTLEYTDYAHNIKDECEKSNGRYVLAYHRTDCDKGDSSFQYAERDDPYCVGSTCNSNDATTFVENAFKERLDNKFRDSPYQCNLARTRVVELEPTYKKVTTYGDTNPGYNGDYGTVGLTSSPSTSPTGLDSTEEAKPLQSSSTSRGFQPGLCGFLISSLCCFLLYGIRIIFP